jgi:flagellar basal-body rod modification protein FlgD
MVNAVSATSSTTPVNTSAGATLGKDDFLKLLVTQMQNQDPLNPTDTTQMASTLAQYSTLEQMTNMSSSTSWTQALDLIGMTVTGADSSGNPVTGQVIGLDAQSGSPLLNVQGVDISPDTLKAVS